MFKDVQIAAHQLPFKVRSVGLASLYTLLGLISTLWLTWYLLAQIDFSYPIWYDWLSIDQLIQDVGPENQYKLGLEACSAQEHATLFSQIVDAIHTSEGKGLEHIRYCNAQGQLLLREPEIIHLQDVAHLLKVFKWVGILATVFWIALAIGLRHQRLIPQGKQLGVGLAAIFGILALVLILFGPVDVFYALHDWVFPEGHQWFFYYQESLMTTLMKAPDLFGAIALEWGVAACAAFVCAHWAFQWRMRT